MHLEREFRSPRSLDLIISGKIYVEGRLIDAAIGVEGGKIAWIGKSSCAPFAEKVVRADEKTLILPGMVDMHVHMRDLDESDKEDWYTGTLSALIGGVTFIADMPNNQPPARNLEVLKMKEEVASKRALVDYGFYAGVPLQSRELERMSTFGLIGLKVYPEDQLHKELIDILREAKRLDLLTVAHAEDPLILNFASKLEKGGFDRHSLIRPAEGEALAIRRLALLGSRIGFRLHLTHVSSAAALKAAVETKIKVGASIDTAIHYLLLDSSSAKKFKGIAKVNPPLRGEHDVRIIRCALKTGIIDAIVTDHAPHKVEEKTIESYENVPAGFPGLELCLPLLTTLIARGEVPLNTLELYSSRPAKLLRVPKGRVEVGFDADFVFMNLGEKWRIKGKDLKSKAKYTPFEDFEVVGRIRKVFVRGVQALEDEDILVNKGYGRRYWSKSEIDFLGA
ncbi:MAG: dihydroorotase family protein [Thermofilaceae archaeon]